MRPIAWGDDFPAAMVLSARRTAELGVEFRREAFGYSTHSRTSSRAATLNTAMELEVFAFLFSNFAENLKSLRCPSRKWNHVVWRHSPARKKTCMLFLPCSYYAVCCPIGLSTKSVTSFRHGKP